MNTIQKGVTMLLRCAITGECLSLPEDFRLEDALPVIRNHGIITLAYEGAVRCGVDQNLPVMKELFQGYYKMMLQSERQVREAERLFAAFQENGIDFMPLKGCKMKALYPRPELRTMGDADVLIRVEQYEEKIKPILVELGFAYTREIDHELDWSSQSLYLDLHKRLIPSVNEKYFTYFGDGWHLAVPESGTRYTMTPENEFLFLFTHFTKHFRNGGIGCRHVVDLWVYLRSNPDLDEEKVCGELLKLGLLKFYQNIRTLMRAWFEDGPENVCTEMISTFVFASGNWGDAEAREISLTLRKTKGSSKKGKLGYLLFHCFPGVKVLRVKYRILWKAPWMLPLVWLYRPFYKLLFERKDLARIERNVKLINQESLERQIQFLRFVGLDEKFE